MTANLRTALWVANFVLLAALAYAASVTTAMLLEKYLAVNTPRVETVRAGRAVAAPRDKLPLTTFQSIAEINIFHARHRTVAAAAAPGAPAATAGPAQAAPAATLTLTLTGTFVVRPVAYAFVTAPPANDEKVYAVGDCIPIAAGAEPTRTCAPTQGVLKQVRQDHIVVAFQGQDVNFYLKREGEEAMVAPAVAAIRSAAVAPEEAPPALPEGFGGAPFPSTQTGNEIQFRVPNADVESAFQNFSDILRQARVVPYVVNGENQGFKILRIIPGSIFQRLGLHDNDIIQKVNGESLANADQALRLFTLFKNEREVVLDVNRNNSNLKLSYIIE